MIQRLRIQNYKALRDVTLDLTPIHVLIGPNDSGKTSILEAGGAMCRSVDHPLHQAFMGAWKDAELVWSGDAGSTVTLGAHAVTDAGGHFDYSLACKFSRMGGGVSVAEESIRFTDQPLRWMAPPNDFSMSGVCGGFTNASAGYSKEAIESVKLVRDTLRGVRYFRWDPQALALPAAPNLVDPFQIETSGFGLSRCLDEILGSDRRRFEKIEDQLRHFFPALRSIKLQSEKAYKRKAPTDDSWQDPAMIEAAGKGLYFELHGSATLVPASQASDGMLLVLAYIVALSLPDGPRLILIEEPENGVHPKRLEELLKVLRSAVGSMGHSQLLLSTHSPYVVDFFEPHEVTLCRKGEDGSVTVRRLSESKTVHDQIDIFTLGEIWTAEGDDALAKSVETSATAAP